MFLLKIKRVLFSKTWADNLSLKNVPIVVRENKEAKTA